MLIIIVSALTPTRNTFKHNHPREINLKLILIVLFYVLVSYPRRWDKTRIALYGGMRFDILNNILKNILQL